MFFYLLYPLSGNPIRDILVENFPELLKYTKPQCHSIIHEMLYNGHTFYCEENTYFNIL